MEELSAEIETESMNYTDIPAGVWRMKRGKVQIRCPLCDQFFNVPRDIAVFSNGNLSDKLYHFCEDTFVDEENTDGWVVLAHLEDWH